MRGALFGALLAVLVVAGRPGATDDRRSALFTALASAVWQAVGDGQRIAAWPIDPDATGLPPDLAGELDAALAEALLRTAPPSGRLIDRSGLPATWEEAMTFQGAASETLLREAAVDALVIPSAHATADGVAVSATVVAVGGGNTGRLLGAVPMAILPESIESMTARPPSTAARIAGVALAEALRLGLDPAGRFPATLRISGERSPFGDWFLGQVAEHLTARLAERPLYVTRPLRQADGGGRPVGVRLEAEIWDHGDRVDVHLRAVADSVEARASARIDAAAVPAPFRPLTPDGGRLGTGYRMSDGAAAVGPDLRRDELGVAAEAVARALLIDEALDVASTTPTVARSRAEVADAWRRLADAVPHGEAWSGAATGPNAAARRLQARVARIGGADAPTLSATLDRPAYRIGEPLRVRATVERGRAFVAVYVWQADGGVVRIVPADGRSALTVEAGQRVDLPGRDDPAIAVAPMPEVSESLEAVIVVASAVPFDPDRMAPGPGRSSDASLQRAVSSGAFLERLAGLDRSRLRLAILPYRVRRGE